MNVLLLGYGKMGKAIESILINRGHTTISVDNLAERDKVDTNSISVAIEFSTPDTAFDNIKYALQHNIPVLCGTTGWLDKLEQVKLICEKANGTFFYASNYSLGVNIFFQLNKKFAQVMNKFDQYDVQMNEVHHIHKLDSPSGTAISLAELIIEQYDQKVGWKEGTDNKSLINIKSERIGETPGTHHVQYKSDIDSIELIHTAHSRKGFAKGAAMVAEWLYNKKGILNMDDFLGDLMN